MNVKLTLFDSYENALCNITALLDSGKKVFVVAINAEKLYRASVDSEILNVLNQAELYICDGVGARLATFILHGRWTPRITGVRLFSELIKSAEKNQKSVFLLGGSPEVNQSTALKLKSDYPSLRLAGRMDGYFDKSSDAVEAINNSEAELVFVALGSPKQELWITENRGKLNADFCMGVGGSFDVVCGTVKRAPIFFRKTGTEWLHRLLAQPTRWRRQLALPKFVLLLLKVKIRALRSDSPNG